MGGGEETNSFIRLKKRKKKEKKRKTCNSHVIPPRFFLPLFPGHFDLSCYSCLFIPTFLFSVAAFPTAQCGGVSRAVTQLSNTSLLLFAHSPLLSTCHRGSRATGVRHFTPVKGYNKYVSERSLRRARISISRRYDGSRGCPG